MTTRLQSPNDMSAAGRRVRAAGGGASAVRRARDCSSDGTRGFTLLELVVVMSILALLAGAAIPVARRLVDSAARRATRAELEVLAEAAGECFRDTWRLPAKLEDLLEDPGTPGWTGPYVEVTGRDAEGRSDALLDGWSRPYVLMRDTESRVRIASRALDGMLPSSEKENEELHGDRGELEVVLDVTPIRRARTLETLRILNAALERYHAEHPSQPLPADPAAILARLVSADYLPASEPWSRDGWGEPFVCDPPKATPVVRLTSRRFLR